MFPVSDHETDQLICFDELYYIGELIIIFAMGKKIVIVTIGSLGDLHPFIATAKALEGFGHEPVMAVPKNYVAKVENAGLKAFPVFPGFDDLSREMGISEAQFAMRLMADIDFMFGKVVLPALGESARLLDEICNGVDLIFGSPFAFAGDIIAEKRAIAFAAGVLQPGLILSAYDPIYSPQARVLKLAPQTRMGIGWNQAWIKLIKFASHARYGNAINKVRRAHGVPDSRFAPFLDPNKVASIIAMYSEFLGGVQPDYYPNTHITGFPIFDSESGAPESLDDELEAFLQKGPPPLIFTLGSLAVHAAADFYRTSQKIAADLSQRAILLTGIGTDLTSSDNILVRSYLPHSQIFPQSSAIIHHGGIGTTGQVLRAGKPQLVVPHLGDQWDNGKRIERLGTGLMLDAKKYTYANAKDRISQILEDQAIAEKASSVGAIVAKENGAKNAAALISSLLE